MAGPFSFITKRAISRSNSHFSSRKRHSSSGNSLDQSGQPIHQSNESMPCLPVSPNGRSYPWKPGVWARLPWSGLTSLLGVVLLTGASFSVLQLSNGSPIENWHVMRINIQPQVWVSIFSTVANALLAYALAEGMAVLFWRQAGRGVMVRNLHYSYESTSIIPAAVTLLHGKWNAVAIACILVTASAIGGPLFQRASTVHNRSLQPLPNSKELQIAQVLTPDYFWDQSSPDPLVLSPQIKQVINDLAADTHYLLNDTGCGDICTTSVKGVGFRMSCEASSYDFNVDGAEMVAIAQSMGCSLKYTAEDDFFWNSTGQYEIHPDPKNAECIDWFRYGVNNKSRRHWHANVFSVYFNSDRVAGESQGTSIGSGINITSVFKDTPKCKGIIPVHRCSLRQGIVDYAVTLKNNTISLQHPHWQSDTFLQEIPVTHRSSQKSHWAAVFQQLFPPVRVNYQLDIEYGLKSARYGDCSALSVSNKRNSTQSNTTCSFDNIPLGQPSYRDLSAIYIKQSEQIQSLCNLTWNDPMQDMLDGMRQFAFRVSLSAASVADRSSLFPGLDDSDISSLTANWTQRVQYIGTQSVYGIDSTYVVSAVVVSLVGVFAVIPLFYGWWELGRPVSLNPLEIAKAFGAPLLDKVNSNADNSSIVKQVGRAQIRYGAVKENQNSELSWRLQMMLNHDGRAQRPEPDTTFV